MDGGVDRPSVLSEAADQLSRLRSDYFDLKK